MILYRFATYLSRGMGWRTAWRTAWRSAAERRRWQAMWKPRYWQ
jgi:hypothetical protein